MILSLIILNTQGEINEICHETQTLSDYLRVPFEIQKNRRILVIKTVQNSLQIGEF